MAKNAPPELVCAHCGKTFSADVLGSNTELAGVKCPHCRLFMPLERAERGAA
jgi:DNA-directed RNA polymerase subunit RPC12/RpoP